LIDGTTYGQQSQYHAVFFASGTSAEPITTAIENISDGTSNTIALSETVQGLSQDGGHEDLRGLIWFSVSCFFNTNQPPNTMEADIAAGYFNATTLHVRHPLTAVNSSGTDGDGDYSRFSARSWHVGGVNAGLADGSVRFITNQIDLEIWRAAGSTNGGEIVSLP
jgi:prepilin-type processing-associated H-X9-DG protein